MASGSQTRVEREAGAEALGARQDRAWALGQIAARQEEQGRDVAKAKADGRFFSTAVFDEQTRIRAAEERLAGIDGGGAGFGAGGGGAQVRLTANGLPRDPVPFESWLRTGEGEGEAAVYVPDDDGRWGPVMCGGRPVGPDSGTAGALKSNPVAGRDVRIWPFSLADAGESGRVLLVVYRRDGGRDVKYALTVARNPSDDLGGYYRLLRSEVVARVRKVGDGYALDPLYSGPVVVEDRPDESFEFRNRDPLSPDPSANPCRVSSGTVYYGGVGLHASAHTFGAGYSGPVFCRVSSSSADVSGEPSGDSGTSNILIFTAVGAMPAEDNRATFLAYGEEGGGSGLCIAGLDDSSREVLVGQVCVGQSGNASVDVGNHQLLIRIPLGTDYSVHDAALGASGPGSCKTLSMWPSGESDGRHCSSTLAVDVPGDVIANVLGFSDDGAVVVAGLRFNCSSGTLDSLPGKVKIRVTSDGKLETYVDTTGQHWETLFRTKPLSEAQQ